MQYEHESLHEDLKYQNNKLNAKIVNNRGKNKYMFLQSHAVMSGTISDLNDFSTTASDRYDIECLRLSLPACGTYCSYSSVFDISTEHTR